jgi:hypothetical protein
VSNHVERVGDDTAGFSFSFEARPPVLRVRGWGFWSVEVAAAFGSKLKEACRHHPAGTALHLDMRDLKPMREEGQASFGALLQAAGRLGIAEVVIATQSSMTKLQLARIAADHATHVRVQFT